MVGITQNSQRRLIFNVVFQLKTANQSGFVKKEQTNERK